MAFNPPNSCLVADQANVCILQQYAREMRGNPTEGERCMWQLLKGRLFGKRFRRQFIIGNYIADFACVEERLVIELDGGYHTEELQQLHDAMRTEWLEQFGYRVLRFTNDEVIGNPDGVLSTIFITINNNNK